MPKDRPTTKLRFGTIFRTNQTIQESIVAITASKARAELFPLIERVNADHTPIEIISKKGSAVLMSLADFEALEETAYLLRTPANAAHLLESIAQHRASTAVRHELTE
jgi:antitoxin YefM